MNFVTTQILIVDDNLEDQKNSHQYLLQDQQHNYNIIEAKTGEEALLLCQQEFPDVILLDNLLPDMDGLEVLKRLKALRGTDEVPALMLIEKGNEAIATTAIATTAIATGACEYIIKDKIATETLRIAINFAITRDRNQRQLEACRLPKILTPQPGDSSEQPFAELSDHPFQALFDSALDAIVIADDDGRYIDVNPAACELFGLPKQELLGLRIVDFAAPGFDFSQAWQSFCEQGHSSGEFQLHRPDGTIREVEFRATSNFLPHHHLSILRDISDRKAAFAECKHVEAALRESERRYATLTEAAPVAIFWLDASGYCTYVNDRWSEMTGRPTDAAMGMGWLETVHPDDREYVISAWNELCDHQQPGQPYRLEARILRPDHSIVWYYCLMLPETDSTGSRIGYVGSLIDISDRQQAQEKIREQAALLDITADAIFVCDLQQCISYWNHGAEHLYGWQAAEVISKNCYNFLYQQISSQVEAAFKTVVEKGEWQGELNHITKSGQEIIVQSRWTLVCDRTGQATSILCVDTDITEKKHLESQFYRAQRLESLGTLASGIAHDLNNILTPILTVAQLLKLKLPNLNEQNLRLLKILEDSSKRGAELVKQILSFARGVEGKHVPLQLTHLLKEVEQVVNSTFPKSIKIHLHIPTPNLCLVLADPTQIHQVLMNLCVNARDAMPEGGNLSISAENYYVDDNYARMNLESKPGDYVVITVSDTGCGMSKEVRERIFEPFFTTKEHGKGTGLGLATVIGIIKNHGGFVNVQSELGEGCQFQIYLPAIQQGITSATEDLQTIRGKGELILVVDDEAFVRDVVKSSLEEFNYKVLVASDGIEAFSLYAQHKNEISLVLMDIQMPSIDGLKAIRVLQQINPCVKIIIISGLASNRQALQFSNINVQAFLAKPYRIKELLASIQEVLSKT
ncbi:multi-sensor hybrid histidine kinase [Calothrix sp. NIES-4101]|nr:multi-sensor hybrid histidine kinase [Calothrix sp. NIES-4101]